MYNLLIEIIRVESIISVNHSNLNRVKNSHSKQSLSTTSVSSDKVVTQQLRNVLNDTQNVVMNSTLEFGIPFIKFQDQWNKSSLFGRFYDKYNSVDRNRRYKRGSKVFVDFGIGLDKETALPHPGIVLYDFPKNIIVAPTTSDDGNKLTGEILKGLIYCKGDGNIFPHDTIINLHQIRVVSKNRIIRDLKADAGSFILDDAEIDRINNYLPAPILEYQTNLLHAIEIKIAHLLSPYTLFEMKALQDEVTDLLEENARLNDQLEAVAKSTNA